LTKSVAADFNQEAASAAMPSHPEPFDRLRLDDRIATLVKQTGQSQKVVAAGLRRPSGMGRLGTAGAGSRANLVNYFWLR